MLCQGPYTCVPGRPQVSGLRGFPAILESGGHKGGCQSEAPTPPAAGTPECRSPGSSYDLAAQSLWGRLGTRCDCPRGWVQGSSVPALSSLSPPPQPSLSPTQVSPAVCTLPTPSSVLCGFTGPLSTPALSAPSAIPFAVPLVSSVPVSPGCPASSSPCLPVAVGPGESGRPELTPRAARSLGPTPGSSLTSESPGVQGDPGALVSVSPWRCRASCPASPPLLSPRCCAPLQREAKPGTNSTDVTCSYLVPVVVILGVSLILGLCIFYIVFGRTCGKPQPLVPSGLRSQLSFQTPSLAQPL